MADETDKPLTELAKAEDVIDAKVMPVEPVKPIPADETDYSAAARLKAFEDETFGPDAPRINGAVERGIGSPYAAMTPELRAQHAALENLVAAEQKLADAHGALMKADADCEAAADAVAAAKEQANAG